MTYHRAFALLAAALSVSPAGCSDSTVFSPAPEVQKVGPGPATPPPPAFPTAASTAQVYDRVTPSVFDGSSRYVFYADSTFSLQYVTPRFGFFEYKGRYARSGSAVSFDWDGWSSAGPWGADGVISGDSLTVKYNVIMSLSDFEDGVYVRSSGAR